VPGEWCMDEKTRDQLIEKAAEKLQSWGLKELAWVFLETYRPFRFLGAQLLVALQPLLCFSSDSQFVRDWASLLEDEESLERLLKRLEEP